MPVRDALKAGLRRAVPVGVRERGKRALAARGLLAVPGAEHGLVTVVVATADASAAAIGDSLDSVRAQTHAFLEVLVLVAGDAEAGVREAVAAHARADSRLRAVDVEVDPWSAGVAAASGRFLAFLRAGDRLPPRGIAAMAGALAGSSAVMAVGRLRQSGRPDDAAEAVQRRVHAQRSSAVDAAALPELVADLCPGNRLVRTDFWRDHVTPGTFDGDWLRSPAVAAAVLAAPGLEVLPEVTYELVRRGPEGVFGATPPVLQELTDWAALAERVLALAGSREVIGEAWVRDVLGGQLPRFLDDAERATTDQWEALRQIAAAWRERASAGTWASVPVEARTKVWLAARGDRAGLEDFVADRWFEEGDLSTLVEDSEVLADWPGAAGALPDEVRRLSDDEAALVVSVRRLRWRGDVLELEGAAYVRHVDLQGTTPDLTLTLTSHAQFVDLPVEQYADPSITRFAGDRFQDYASGAFRVRVDPADLAGRDGGDGRWQLSATFVARGLSRSGAVTQVDAQAAPGRLPERTVDGRRISVDTRDGFSLLVAPAESPAPEERPGPAFVLRDVTLDGLTLRLTGQWRDVPAERRLALTSPRGTVEARMEPEGDTVTVPLTWSELGLPDSPLPAGPYRLRAGTTAAPVAVEVAEELRARLPEDQLSTSHRLRVRMQGTAPVLQLGPPLADDELGPHAQQRLRAWYVDQVGRAPVDPGLVYLQSYTGEAATDSQLDLFHELRRRRPDLRFAWGVADASCRLPDGARPVLMRSREWYATLATAGCVLVNIDLERWFHKRDGQLVVQTYHGHPSKTMGLDLWRAKGFTPRRIAAELDRTGHVWDVVLSPSPEMDHHFREQFDFHGDVLGL
ncbi:MAG: bifunctional glycosyltransferase/CDP-glycerol:glycerophosphate glycerophosphotransferase, partial [Nocardioidaceae bacterium]